MNTIWHPFTQHGLEEDIIKISYTRDEFLISSDGRKIIDGISSWWVNTLGHRNPKIMKAIEEEAKKTDQLIFAGFTHEPALKVAELLGEFLPEKLKYTFFSDSGSTSVEVALKMAVGYFYNKFGKDKSKIVAFEHSYHGDTFGGMSSGARSVFNKPYSHMLFDVIHIPYPEKGLEDKTISAYRKLLEQKHNEIGAIILEPLVLGSGGMLTYEPFVLDELYKLSKEYDIEEVDSIPRLEKKLRINIWKVQIPALVLGKAEDVEVYILFPKDFPYSMPCVIIPDDRFKYLPHISVKTRKLCLYEDGEVYDAENIEGLIRDNIYRTRRWIENYYGQDNSNEYAKEIRNYWNEEYDGENSVDDHWILLGDIPTETCEMTSAAYVGRNLKDGSMYVMNVVASDENDKALAGIKLWHETKEIPVLYIASLKIPDEPP